MVQNISKLHLTPPNGTPSECPSLVSDLSSHGELPASSTAPQSAPATCAALAGRAGGVNKSKTMDSSKARGCRSALPPTKSEASTLVECHEEAEPPVFSSIREVLSRDFEYAEQVIAAVKQLPPDKRDVLLQPAFDSEWIRVSEGVGLTKQTVTAPGASPGQTSSSTRRGKKQSEETGRAGPSEDKSKRPRKQTAPSNGGDEDDGSGDGDGNGPRNRKQKKIGGRWACPYGRAFPHISRNSKFSACRPPSYWDDRSKWK